ncbi:protein yellow-like [Ruditapes philippinarum]|uniref:protein yellow-like n=1 Tax=Ruditapes philippinarum TaxID=129788 RepID=UPI00295A90EA|nr:protein yellow-like [Ruditapes philippinarum]
MIVGVNSVLVLVFCFVTIEMLQASQTGEIVFELATVDYEWKTEWEKQTLLFNGNYVVENNIITGIKVHKDDVFVTVPRWRQGVPSTLNVLVPRTGKSPVLRPFPSWEMNKIGDCDAFQYVQSMEVDPNTGYMWIIDIGKGSPLPSQKNCPPKLVVIEIATKKMIKSYTFPANVVSPVSNFMNDIMLDYVQGQARYAYITDTRDAKLYVYDVINNMSYFFVHETMKAQPLIPGLQDNLISAPIDGIAMSADFKFVYYTPLTTHKLYAVPTSILRNKSSEFGRHVINVGNKSGGSDGMVCGQRSIFYAGFEQNAVYKATVPKNDVVSMGTETLLVANNSSVVWVDTFGFNGTDLWFVANKLNYFNKHKMSFSGNVTNMFIWKINVDENSYLYRAIERTAKSMVPGLFG